MTCELEKKKEYKWNRLEVVVLLIDFRFEVSLNDGFMGLASDDTDWWWGSLSPGISHHMLHHDYILTRSGPHFSLVGHTNRGCIFRSFTGHICCFQVSWFFSYLSVSSYVHVYRVSWLELHAWRGFLLTPWYPGTGQGMRFLDSSTWITPWNCAAIACIWEC